jgi:hypothetical protein
MANIGNLTEYYIAQTPKITVANTTIGITAVNFSQKTETKITRTASGRTIRASNSTTLWGGTLEFAPDTQSQYKNIKAFLAKARGPLNEFNVVIPGVSEFNGTLKGTPTPTFTVNGNISAGATTISVNATTVGAINGTRWEPGMVIRFASHTKVYMVTNTNGVLWTSNGNQNVTIEPPLVSAITTASTITYEAVPFTVIATNDLQEYSYTNNGLVGYRLDIQEVI